MDRKGLIIVINGSAAIEGIETDYRFELADWKSECAGIRASYRMKTSVSEKNGVRYEYTNCYRETGSGLKCVGKEMPDFDKIMPPEPQSPITFEYWELWDGEDSHIVMSGKDWEENWNQFTGTTRCFAFRLEDCQSKSHPLYMNPVKELTGSSCSHYPGANTKRPETEETETG